MSNEHPGIQLPEGLLPGVTFIPNGTFITFFVQKEADKETTAKFFEEFDGLVGDNANVSYDEKTRSVDDDVASLCHSRNEAVRNSDIRYSVRRLPSRRLLATEHADLSFSIIGASAAILIELVKCRGNIKKESRQTIAIRSIEPSKPKPPIAADDSLTITVNGRACSGKTTLALLLTKILGEHHPIKVEYKNYHGEPIPEELEIMDGVDLLKLLYGKQVKVVDGAPVTTPAHSESADFLRRSSAHPKNVMAVVLKCPDWFTHEQKRGFEWLVETMPSVISGLESGLKQIAVDASRVESQTVRLLVKETCEFEVRAFIESIVDAAGLRQVIENSMLPGHEKQAASIGPFEIAFIEPNQTYTDVVDGWVSDGWYLDGPYCKRSAGRDITAISPRNAVEYEFNLITKAMRYGPRVRRQLQPLLEKLNSGDREEPTPNKVV